MVCLEYVLSLVDGTVVDSTEGSGLWTYVHGETKMPPGLSRGVEGLEVGEHARLELSPEDAFGAIDPAAFQDVPRAMVPCVCPAGGLRWRIAWPWGDAHSV